MASATEHARQLHPTQLHRPLPCWLRQRWLLPADNMVARCVVGVDGQRLPSTDVPRCAAHQHPEQISPARVHRLPTQRHVRHHVILAREPQIRHKSLVVVAGARRGLELRSEEDVADPLEPSPITQAPARVLVIAVHVARQIPHALTGLDVASSSRLLAHQPDLSPARLPMDLLHLRFPEPVCRRHPFHEPVPVTFRHMVESASHDIQLPAVPVPLVQGYLSLPTPTPVGHRSAFGDAAGPGSLAL